MPNKTAEDPALERLRHSASHVMAQAVCRLFPGVKLAIGPSIKDGFYYDFLFPQPISDEDLPRIEEEMRKIVQEGLPIERVELPRAEAIAMYRKDAQPFKLELLEDIPDDPVSFYRQGSFIDLCRGPHVSNTAEIKALKLTSLAGAYWRGDERNAMLQRIYGTAFSSQKELDAYLRLQEEARKRDHRRIGAELDLFSFHKEGPGFPFFHPKGMIILNQLLGFWREVHAKHGYQEVRTPIILARSLWEQSGHWDHYRANMYFTEIEEAPYAVKPMNCPGGMLVFKSRPRSYRDLPLRLAELGLVHRHEKSGVLHGLFRVRMFTQDDAHIFLLPEQIEPEVISVIDLVDSMYKVFGLSYQVELSTRPKDFIGTDGMWEQATKALDGALRRKGIEFKVNPGEGAFYGPKIDFHIEDAIGRTWQCATIQLDFAMPERFEIEYTGADGNRHRPAVIHRVVLGAIERFFGILVEHYAGKFPVWLSPVQVRVIPITDEQGAYAEQVHRRFLEAGLRSELDGRSENLNHKIREATVEKVPYMAIVGQKEVERRNISLRARDEGNLGSTETESFIARLQEQIQQRR